MSIHDMGLNIFRLSNKYDVKSCSTPDHGVAINNGNCKQSDGYNYGIFILLTMILRCRGKAEYLSHVYAEDNLKK